MSARFIVTRPATTAAAWVDALRARGLEACGLPLIEIVPEEFTGALRQARERLADWHAVMFVSGNAVRCFFASAPGDSGLAAPLPRAWAPGDGTRAALLRAGWPPNRIDSPAPAAHQFESESLWRAVASQVQAGTRVLIVRGGGADGRAAGRNWLAEQVAAAGGQVEQVVAYRRRAPDLSADTRDLLRRAGADGSIWLFSSAEALAHLAAMAPGQRWRGARAIVTHERIGRAAQAMGFQVLGAARPTLPEVIALAETLA